MHKQQEQHQTALGYQAVSSDKDDNTSATVDEVAMDSITLSSPSERRDDNDLLEEDDPASAGATAPPNAIPEDYNSVSTIAQLSPVQNEVFFQNVFEIGRRNKVLNPSKMRGAYGKLMHLLQDTQSRTIAKSLGFSLYKDMLMVRPILNDRNATPILDEGNECLYASLDIPPSKTWLGGLFAAERRSLEPLKSRIVNISFRGRGETRESEWVDYLQPNEDL